MSFARNRPLNNPLVVRSYPSTVPISTARSRWIQALACQALFLNVETPNRGNQGTKEGETGTKPSVRVPE